MLNGLCPKGGTEDAEKLKTLLHLEKHSRGFYKETYRCQDIFSKNLTAERKSFRDLSKVLAQQSAPLLSKFSDIEEIHESVTKLCYSGSAMYFLLEAKSHLTWHMNHGHDELIVHHTGSAVKVHTITLQGNYDCRMLGDPLTTESAEPQLLISRYTWTACELVDKTPSSYALTGALVCPGFELDDSKQANIHEMIKTYPQHSKIIKQLAED